MGARRARVRNALDEQSTAPGVEVNVRALSLPDLAEEDLTIFPCRREWGVEDDDVIDPIEDSGEARFKSSGPAS